jgi:HEAT repeat protein
VAAALLPRGARHDPDPAVRGRALVRLGEIGGAEAADRVAVGLYDPAQEVRLAAATSLAALGPAAVPELRAVVDSGSNEAAQAAIAGLMLGGSREGSEALGEIAASHPDPTLRKLAKVALGGDLGHEH